MNLAWKVALVQKSLAHPSLLSTYELERLPTIAEMLNKTTELHNKAFHTPATSTLDAGASVADPKAAKDPMFRPATGSQLGVNYRWSPLAIDGRALGHVDEGKNPYGLIGDKVRAGDRAPDAPGLKQVSALTGNLTDSVTTLYKVIAGCDKHHILAFTGGDTVDSGSLAFFDRYVSSGVAATSVILASGTTVGSLSSGANRGVRWFVDEAGHAFNGYDVEAVSGKTVYVVIRPDGMVGAYALETEQVEMYFQKVLNGV